MPTHARSEHVDMVRMARRMRIVPELQRGLPLREQTKRTRWALHVLSQMVQTEGFDVDPREVRHMIDATIDLIDSTQSSVELA